MITNIDKLTEGCSSEKKDKVCRSRGGESCAFDGAMIVLQPIADTAHLVHGPIACLGNSWEGRGSLSHEGTRHAMPLIRMGFTTDMNEMDIIYGAEKKLHDAILQTCQSVSPKAIFVYATCVSGLTGEDIESGCKKAENESGVRIIPVNAPGFTGPKNLGNRIAGEVLLDHVIGTGEPEFRTDFDVNLIGEYNIAGDLWLIEPVFKAAGIRILSRITGNATFEEITYAHRARLNLVVCSRALINVAREMERKYGIPYKEVSFFGKTEMSKALRATADVLSAENRSNSAGMHVQERFESIIKGEEEKLHKRLKKYDHLIGKRAVLYTGGVKSWSFISALSDLGIEVVAVGTKKSTFEDEEKMREILGPDAPLIEDVTPKNLLQIIKEKNADILIAGGRNQYLAVKEGIPFVDVNQERHTAYAGYEGLVNLARDISSSLGFYERKKCLKKGPEPHMAPKTHADVLINPLKHSQSIGAAIAFQGIHKAVPVIHGAQGCNFLGKVLLTKHFKEPISLISTKLFTEDVVMGSDERLRLTIENIIEKYRPDVIGVITTGLSEVKGDDVAATIRSLALEHQNVRLIHVPTPDYEGGLEKGYAAAVEGLIDTAEKDSSSWNGGVQINVLAGHHLTPADFNELREIVESFKLRPLMIPDLSALDGSREGFSPLAFGGTSTAEISRAVGSAFTIAIGMSMENAAKKLKYMFGTEYRVFEGLAGIEDTDSLIETLSFLGRAEVPEKYGRQRRMLVDGMRDAHLVFGDKKVCLGLEPDLSLQFSKLLHEMGSEVALSVVPSLGPSCSLAHAREVREGDLYSIEGKFDLLISNSHGADTAERLGAGLYQSGFPVYKVFGSNTKVTIGYKGTLATINEIANIFVREVH